MTNTPADQDIPMEGINTDIETASVKDLWILTGAILFVDMASIILRWKFRKVFRAKGL